MYGSWTIESMSCPKVSINYMSFCVSICMSESEVVFFILEMFFYNINEMDGFHMGLGLKVFLDFSMLY